jgi:hypothetical protein
MRYPAWQYSFSVRIESLTIILHRKANSLIVLGQTRPDILESLEEGTIRHPNA